MTGGQMNNHNNHNNNHNNNNNHSPLNPAGISSLLQNSGVDVGSNGSVDDVNRTTLLAGQPSIMEPYTSPFAALGGGLSLGEKPNYLFPRVTVSKM